MLRLVALTCLLALAIAQDEDMWTLYKLKHNKVYNDIEDPIRRDIFESAVATIHQHNLMADLDFHTYRQGLNPFTDMTNEEFATTMTGFRGNAAESRKNPLHVVDGEKLPTSVDWRTKGYVTSVKKQGKCNSDYAFAAIGALEGQNFNATGKLVNISVQNIVDCSDSQGDMGCIGGDPNQAYVYVIENKGIDTEECYPYKAKDQDCKYNVSCIGATMRSAKDLPRNEQALQHAIANVGPVALIVDAKLASFKHYKSGVYNEPNCKSAFMHVNHGVLAVGYGADDSGNQYYIVKNSWGTDWGMKGYIWMSRNKNNQCGVDTCASYPIV